MQFYLKGQKVTQVIPKTKDYSHGHCRLSQFITHPLQSSLLVIVTSLPHFTFSLKLTEDATTLTISPVFCPKKGCFFCQGSGAPAYHYCYYFPWPGVNNTGLQQKRGDG
ncbi:hypothetical protein JTE90_015182 [Oedothorax gibbosus]|uniref:Uncharacterized protein n=1 Tax=Oedothorax gibbosus TaxID=931172 RepID=A0AAV6V7V0_9ARAC|nr:hypothetical protein JTE90_015182 [Oedothorax gibbosus]